MEVYEKLRPGADPFIVGVVADTHIPDRVDALHPSLLDELRRQGVHLILHAGDISVARVLPELAQIAPVRAVTGNRDFLLKRQLPHTQRLEIFGSKVSLTHGHMGPRIYWQDKLAHYARGYAFERYQQRFDAFFADARVIIFGHTHHPENRWIDGRLYFNPGSASHGDRQLPQPTFGLLKFYEDGRIESSLIPLTGAAIRMKKWEIKIK